MKDETTIWLSCSGGGLRAALFHFGALIRLREVGLLQQVIGFSATSGGSLIALHWAASGYPGRNDDGDDVWQKFEASFLQAAKQGLLRHHTLLLTAYILYVLAAILFIIPWLDGVLWLVCVGLGVATHIVLMVRVTLSRAGKGLTRIPIIEEHEPTAPYETIVHANSPRFRLLRSFLFPSVLYELSLDALLYRGKFMGDLGWNPRPFVTATELTLGKEFVFSNYNGGPLESVRRFYHEDLGLGGADSLAPGYICDRASIASIAAGSMAFPLLLGPIRLKEYFGQHTKTLALADGGMVDNFALMVPLNLTMQSRRVRTDAVLGFDATSAQPIRRLLPLGWLGAWSSLGRVFLNDQITGLRFGLKALRDASIYTSIASIHDWFMPGVFSIKGFEFSDFYHTSKSWDLDSETVELVGEARTSLGRFSESECLVLAYVGYLAADWQIRLMARTGPVQSAASLREALARPGSHQPLDRFLADHLPGAERELVRIKEHLRSSKYHGSLVRSVVSLGRGIMGRRIQKREGDPTGVS